MANQIKNTDRSWKEKAIDRQIENKDLRKRLKESKTSRDQWKNKAFQRKEKIKRLEDEVDSIKKNLAKIIEKI
jgi:hypothetical protein